MAPKARVGAPADWLHEAWPEEALPQEVRSVDEVVTCETFQDCGYNVESYAELGGRQPFGGTLGDSDSRESVPTYLHVSRV
jgi:hypothetical protein